MKVIAFCNNSCCPSISFNENIPSHPLLIEDDFKGSVPITLEMFKALSTHITEKTQERMRQGLSPRVVKFGTLAIADYVKDEKHYFEISDIDNIGNTRTVKDISSEHWNVFIETINEYFAVV